MGGTLMEVSKRALIITLIVNLLLLAVGVTCIVYLNYSVLALSLFLAATFFVLVSSVFIWKMAKDHRHI